MRPGSSVGDELFHTVQRLSFRRIFESLLLFHRAFHGKYSNELHSLVTAFWIRHATSTKINHPLRQLLHKKKIIVEQIASGMSSRSLQFVRL